MELGQILNLLSNLRRQYLYMNVPVAFIDEAISLVESKQATTLPVSEDCQ